MRVRQEKGERSLVRADFLYHISCIMLTPHVYYYEHVFENKTES